MGNNDTDKKRPRMSSSGTGTEPSEEHQDGAYIKLSLKEYQNLIAKLTAIEDKTKISDQRILNLEARSDEAQGEITSLKRRLGEVNETVNDAKESLEFTQGEHDDLAERVTNCENEQSTHWDELTHIQIYSRRWNLIFYRVSESRDEDCFALVRNVLGQNLNLPMEEVSKMKLCGANRLGKVNRSKSRPLIVRFTCRADRDRVWNARYKLKNSSISVGEDLPRHIQDIRKSTLIPAMKKIKSETPQVKASVVGDNKLIVNGKIYFHYNIPRPSRSCSSAHEKSAPATDSHQEPLSNQDE